MTTTHLYFFFFPSGETSAPIPAALEVWNAVSKGTNAWSLLSSSGESWSEVSKNSNLWTKITDPS